MLFALDTVIYCVIYSCIVNNAGRKMERYDQKFLLSLTKKDREELEREVEKRDRSRFIREAIKEKLEREKKEA